jgi:hypothetical protein
MQIDRDPAVPFGKDFVVVLPSNPILSSYIYIEECSKADLSGGLYLAVP